MYLTGYIFMWNILPIHQIILLISALTLRADTSESKGNDRAMNYAFHVVPAFPDIP